MPKCLDKLENHLKQVSEENRIWKIRNTVQAIEAFQCQLDNIKVVGTFFLLSDLNIGENNLIKSLKGIESCVNLKYLNCNNCDLETISELKGLRKL